MRSNFENDENSVVGIFRNNEIVGLAVLETRNDADGSPYGWIQFYYVSPKWRRYGFGTELVRYSAEYYFSHGLTEMRLRVGKYNIAAQTFYIKNGFTYAPEGDKNSLFGVKALMMKRAIGAILK